MHSQRHNSFGNQFPVGGNVSRLRNHRDVFGDDMFVMPRSPPRRWRSLSHDSLERRDLRSIVRSRSPPIGQMRKVINYGNRSRSPPIMVNFGNRSRSPMLEHLRKMPSYGNRSRSPPIEHTGKIPGDGMRTRSPPIVLMRKMPSYRFRSRSPPIEHSRKILSYRNRSRSPSMEHIRKIPNYEVDVLRKDPAIAEMHGRRDTYEYMDVRSDANAGMNRTSRVMREGLELEDGSSRGIYRMPADMRRPLKINEASGDISSRSMKMGLDQFNDEKIQYPDLLEKPKIYINDAPYNLMPPPQSLDFAGTPPFKDLGSTSTRISRGNLPVSRWDGPPLTNDPLWGKDDYVKGSSKLTEHMGYGDYRERRVFDSGRNPLGVHKDLHIIKDQFSPSRGDRDRKHYLYNRTILGDSDPLDIGRDPKTGTITSSPSGTDPRNYLYPRPGIEETNDHISAEMYEISERMDYGSRPNMFDPDTNEFFHRHPSPQKQLLASRIGMSRSSIASKKYIDTVASQGRKVSREEEVPYFDISNDRDRMLPMTLKLDLARDAGSIYYKEGIRSPEFHPNTEMHRHSGERMRSLEFHYDVDMHKHSVRAQGIRGQDHSTFDPSHRALKRRHNTDEENYWSDSRDIPRDWNGFSRKQYEDDTSKDWIKQHRSNSYSSKRLAYEHEDDNWSRRFSSRTDDTHWLSACQDHSSSYKREEHVPEHSSKGLRSGDKYLKGYSKPGYASYHDSHQYNRNIVLHKPHNNWMKSKDAKKVDLQNEVFPLQKRETLTKSKPSEDSDEFKQLVHTHYLSFTKKLNDNFGVRRRYKEQGRAGSLFCIVCGRSESKEFTDTRRLATHAFMSHKVGLRTQHIGLHKAICVLLGWKSDVATDGTWAPETISSAEALAQKEDLIIWPPLVVIHNGSAPDQGTSVEAVEKFIKGKGVNGGKVKCANNNIMVVKFLGTYSGVQEAEKLHKYFTENRRGRVDFDKITPSKQKNSKISDKTPEVKFNELELYGYMGIAEDLDHVDFDTKKKCSIRSKKEIQDIVDAPVKAE